MARIDEEDLIESIELIAKSLKRIAEAFEKLVEVQSSREKRLRKKSGKDESEW